MDESGPDGEIGAVFGRANRLANRMPVAKSGLRFARRSARNLLPWSAGTTLDFRMNQVKDTLRSTVRISYDGRVFKTFRGPKADERFTNEVRVLRYLESRECPFVPKLLETDTAQLRIVTSSCGTRVDHLDEARTKELFAELEQFGVRHDDPDKRNVTYRQSDGRFCLVDFEFATILPDDEKRAN